MLDIIFPRKYVYRLCSYMIYLRFTHIESKIRGFTYEYSSRRIILFGFKFIEEYENIDFSRGYVNWGDFAYDNPSSCIERIGVCLLL